MRIVVWPSVISQPAAPRCVRRTRALRRAGLRARVMRRVPGLMATASAAAEWLAGARAAGDLAGFDQLDPHVVGRLHERDARAVRNLDRPLDRKSTRLNSSHVAISYAVFCLKKKKKKQNPQNNKKKQK